MCSRGARATSGPPRPDGSPRRTIVNLLVLPPSYRYPPSWQRQIMPPHILPPPGPSSDGSIIPPIHIPSMLHSHFPLSKCQISSFCPLAGCSQLLLTRASAASQPLSNPLCGRPPRQSCQQQLASADSSGGGPSGESKVQIDPGSPRDRRALRRAKTMKELADMGSPCFSMQFY